MADNVAITAGTGTTIGADDVGGVLIQRVKTTWGPDGTANDADVATGKPLPVQLRGPTGTDLTGTAGTASAAVITVQGIASGTAQPASQSGTWTVQPGNTANTTAWKVDGSAVTQPVSIATAPVLVAGAALIGKVDIQVAGSTVATGSGVNGATVIRTALATDSPGIIATGTAGTASSTVLTVQGIAGATPQPVGGVTVTQAASSTITRPADTTAYASGDLVANSTTAGSVTNLQFTTLARVSGGSGVIIGAQIQKSTNSVTNAAFRLHLFNTAPTYTSNGDNTALTTVVVASAKGYLGYIDITAMVGFSDVSWGSGAPDNSRGGVPYVATAQIIYGLLEARGAYTPGNAEVFTVTVDALQD